MAKRMPLFLNLSLGSQSALIKGCILEIAFIRDTTQISIDEEVWVDNKLKFKLLRSRLMSMGLFGEIFQKFWLIMIKILKLKLTDVEVSLICALLILSPDREGLTDARYLEYLETELAMALQRQLIINHGELPFIFYHLMDVIIELRGISTLFLQAVLDDRVEETNNADVFYDAQEEQNHGVGVIGIDLKLQKFDKVLRVTGENVALQKESKMFQESCIRSGKQNTHMNTLLPEMCFDAHDQQMMVDISTRRSKHVFSENMKIALSDRLTDLKHDVSDDKKSVFLKGNGEKNKYYEGVIDAQLNLGNSKITSILNSHTALRNNGNAFGKSTKCDIECNMSRLNMPAWNIPRTEYFFNSRDHNNSIECTTPTATRGTYGGNKIMCCGKSLLDFDNPMEKQEPVSLNCNTVIENKQQVTDTNRQFRSYINHVKDLERCSYSIYGENNKSIGNNNVLDSRGFRESSKVHHGSDRRTLEKQEKDMKSCKTLATKRTREKFSNSLLSARRDIKVHQDYVPHFKSHRNRQGIDGHQDTINLSDRKSFKGHQNPGPHRQSINVNQAPGPHGLEHQDPKSHSTRLSMQIYKDSKAHKYTSTQKMQMYKKNQAYTSIKSQLMPPLIRASASTIIVPTASSEPVAGYSSYFSVSNTLHYIPDGILSQTSNRGPLSQSPISKPFPRTFKSNSGNIYNTLPYNSVGEGIAAGYSYLPDKDTSYNRFKDSAYLSKGRFHNTVQSPLFTLTYPNERQLNMPPSSEHCYPQTNRNICSFEQNLNVNN